MQPLQFESALLLASAVAAWGTIVSRSTGLVVGMCVWLVVLGMRAWRRPLERDRAVVALGTAGFALLAVSPLRLMAAWVFLAISLGGWLALGSRFEGFCLGTFDRRIAVWLIAAVSISAACLVGWWWLWQPDLHDLAFPQWLRGLHPSLFIAVLLGWAVLNAAGEEFFFRGLLQASLNRAWGFRIAIVLQALAFGVAHWNGFPRGMMGVVLATIYGVMMGWLRHRAGGLFAPWLAHVAADTTIALILLHVS